MEIVTKPLKEITLEARNYVNLRIAQLSLSVSKAFARLNATLLVAVIIFGLAGFTMLMLSFAFVFWYGSKVGTYYHGFLIVALFYILTGIFVYIFRQTLFIDPVVRGMIRRINEDMADEGIIPRVHNARELDKQLELISLKLKQSEHQMETKFAGMSQSLHPANLAKEIFGSLLTSSTVAAGLLELLISLLRRRRRG